MAQEHTGRILIVESDPTLQSELEGHLSSIGHLVETAPDGFTALELLERSMPDVILVELDLEGMDGFEFLQQARALLPSASFIAMAESGSTDTAVKALECGADRLLTRPIRPDALVLVVERSLDKPLHARDAMDARAEAAASLPTTRLDHIVGAHPAMQRLFNRMLQAAKSRSTVLIQGETGTGKELVAKAVHEHSLRSEGPLVRLNCAALAESVLESELFGHEKGAFTGAVDRKIGRFELADGATIFLDEIGDLPIQLQAKLLRVLQDREFERLGSSTTRSVDTRVIAATNRDLDQLINQGRFRDDLYYRLGVFPIRLPPLRERITDIPLLVWFFITELQGPLGKTIEKIPPGAMKALASYDWPGNVRELRNVIERAMILSPGTMLELENAFPVYERSSRDSSPSNERRSENLEEVERAHIVKVLEECKWKIRGEDGAAERLGLKRTTLQSRMKRLGIQRPASV